MPLDLHPSCQTLRSCGQHLSCNTSQRSMTLSPAFILDFKSASVESRTCSRICNQPITPPSNSGCGSAAFPSENGQRRKCRNPLETRGAGSSAIGSPSPLSNKSGTAAIGGADQKSRHSVDAVVKTFAPLNNPIERCRNARGNAISTVQVNEVDGPRTCSSQDSEVVPLGEQGIAGVPGTLFDPSI